jgi:hypothetical protein
MTTKTAVIRKLAIANMLIASAMMVFGSFIMENTAAAQTTETAEETPVETQAETQSDTQVEMQSDTPAESPTDVPGAINDLQASAGTLSAILTWTEPAGSPTGYGIEYGTVAGGNFDQICTTNDCIDAVPGAIVTDLEQDLEYMFRVTPSNTAGTGDPSNIVYLVSTGPCSDMGTEEFCGRQMITAPTLRFTNIPDSFDFPPINMYDTMSAIPATQEQEPSGTQTAEETQAPAETQPATDTQPVTSEPEPLSMADYGLAQVFSDIPGREIFPPIDVSSTALNVYNNSDAANQPALADLLGIQDNRNSGGFEVQLQTVGTFTDGTHTIPLGNLFIATSVSSPVYSVPATDTAYPCPATNCGVIYGTSVGTRGILAPADSEGNGLGMPGTYTSDFGSGAVVLMDGGLPSTQGRNGYMYQFLNYYLNVPAFQAAGDYAVKLTFTLIDDTI